MEAKKVLMIGGSAAALRSALERARGGDTVTLVDLPPRPGGEAADRSLWQEVRAQKNIEVLGNAVVESVEKGGGSFRVRIRRAAPRIIEEKCNDCRECIRVCPVSLCDEDHEGLSLRTAIDVFNGRSRAYNVIKERPVCEETCPVHLDVRGYVGLIADGKPAEALRLIREKLPFPGTIGRVCPHPCEEKCNRNPLDRAPLCIRDLKRFAADAGKDREAAESALKKIVKNGKKVAVIGAGPAGLTCAHDLAKLGYGVTVFEASPAAGGMLVLGIPEYRLPRDVLNSEIDDIRRLGVEIRNGVRIGRDLSLDDLLPPSYDATFVAVGAHLGLSARMEHEDAAGVISGVDFLRALNLGDEAKVGARVAVIGGGNVAMDAARSCLRLGAREVTLLYRRSRKEMPASEEEIEAALEEGVRIEYLVAPAGVVKKKGRVAGIRCVRMKLGAPDASGRRRPVPVEGSEFEIELDMILPAIGQTPDLSFLSDNGSIGVTRRGTILVDPVTFSTGKEGVFAAGDCVTGPGIAIEAVAGGKKAAVAIHNYLSGR